MCYCDFVIFGKNIVFLLVNNLKVRKKRSFVFYSVFSCRVLKHTAHSSVLHLYNLDFIKKFCFAQSA